MPATTKVPLGAATLNRKYYLDVNAGTHDAPEWIGVYGITDFKHPLTPTLTDDSDYDSGGFKSQAVTAIAWQVVCILDRKVQDAEPTEYDPGQELLRTTALLMGTGNVVEMRYYEMGDDGVGGPRVEAFQGYGAVSWVPVGGTMEALDTVTMTIDARGRLNQITHPDAVTAVPVIYNVDKLALSAAGGQLVQIRGAYFTGTVATTGVEFASSDAESWDVVSDNLIVAITPVHEAGSGSVVVTNAVGPSTTGPTVTFS